MKLLLPIVEKQSSFLKILSGFALIGVVGACDWITGYELSFSLFYVIPISFFTWFMGRRMGMTASLLSAIVWLSADLGLEHPYSHPLIPLWNSLIRLGFFSVITLLLSQLRSTVAHQTELARTDSLTGAVNSRFFRELLQMEMERSRRYSHVFTLVYIDLDNFKPVNDKYGHSTGDRVLCSVVECASRHLRKVDVIARLGGDEFALLLPETGEASARVTLSRLQAELVEEMQRNNWSVTFSIGAVICTGGHSSADQLIGKADNLMYEAKRDGKNTIRHTTCAD